MVTNQSFHYLDQESTSRLADKSPSHISRTPDFKMDKMNKVAELKYGMSATFLKNLIQANEN